MIISGFQKLTLLDYPNHVACTVFTGGCNLRCPFCHNASLVVGDYGQGEISQEEIFSTLDKRKGVLDGVAITGGEPLLNNDLKDFIIKIKEKGFLVKLDTNGTFPDKLKELIDLKLIDYLAMDIKNSKEKYTLTVGKSEFDLSSVEESVEILLHSDIDYEFRTTVVKEFHDLEDIEKISKWIKGAKKYFLQNFVDSGNLIGQNFSSVGKPTLEKMLEISKKTLPSTFIRGI